LLNQFQDLLQFVSTIRLQATLSGDIHAGLKAAAHEHKMLDISSSCIPKEKRSPSRDLPAFLNTSACARSSCA
jgi:hypothetical protein